MNPGNNPRISATFKNFLRALNFSLLITYATDKVRNVEKMNEKNATTRVFMNHNGNSVVVNNLTKLSKPTALGK